VPGACEFTGDSQIDKQPANKGKGARGRARAVSRIAQALKGASWSAWDPAGARRAEGGKRKREERAARGAEGGVGVPAESGEKQTPPN